MTTLVVGGAVLAIAAGVVVIYNSLVQLKVRGDNAWSDIDVQLERRHDLIPNVVEAVKGYAAHERQTLEAVVEARSRAVAVERAGPAERGRIEGDLTAALRGLFALAESYPQLRATGNFAQLHTALVEVEDTIQNARRYYNAVVRDLNTRIQQFPSNIVAGLFGFRNREFFQVAEADAQVPQVKL